MDIDKIPLAKMQEAVRAIVEKRDEALAMREYSVDETGIVEQNELEPPCEME